MPREHLLKIGVSGIRGVVGEFLTPALACAFAQAFGTYVGRRRRGRRPRYARTGPMLQHAVQCGLLAAGCEVVDLGVLPTPSIQIYVAATRARGGHRAHRLAQSAGIQRAQALQWPRPVLQPLRTRGTARPLSPERVLPGQRTKKSATCPPGPRVGADAAYSTACCGTSTADRVRGRKFRVGAGCRERRGLRR